MSERGATAAQLPLVSFVVPTHRRPDSLLPTLAALLAVDYPADRYEVVVVDDGSGDATAAVVEAVGREAAARVVYLEQDNRGAATARNRGARCATGEILIFVDDDIVVEPSHVRDHLAARTTHGDPLVNGHWEFPDDLAEAMARTPFGRFRREVEQWVKDGIAAEPLADGCTSPVTVTACNLGIRRELFWDLGGFDESFPYAGCEDQELSHRAVRAGCRLVYDRRIRLVHNDRRLDLHQFCQRQQRGACSAVYLARRHPEEYAGRPLMAENGPLRRSDPRRIFVKKLVKQALTWPPSLATVHAGVRALELAAPGSRLLQRLYWSVCGLYIFLGVREGYTAIGPDGPIRHHGSLCR